MVDYLVDIKCLHSKTIRHFVTTNTFWSLCFSLIYRWTLGQLKVQDYGGFRNNPEAECPTDQIQTYPSPLNLVTHQKQCHAENTGTLIMEVRMKVTVCFFQWPNNEQKISQSTVWALTVENNDANPYTDLTQIFYPTPTKTAWTVKYEPCTALCFVQHYDTLQSTWK